VFERLEGGFDDFKAWRGFPFLVPSFGQRHYFVLW
jgi:hypothetical protein